MIVALAGAAGLASFGLVLAGACALAWAGLDAVRKRLSAVVLPLPLLALLNICLIPVFATWWIVAGGTITDFEAYVVPASLALVLQIVANILFLAALRASPLSMTIPFLGLTPAFATLGGLVVLGEQPTTAQLLGVGLVVVGALVLGSAPSAEGERVGLLRAFVRERGAIMMCGVALCWAVTMSLDKRALAHAAVPIHALVDLVGVLVAVLIVLAVRGRLAELRVERSAWALLGLAGLIFAAAFALQLLVIQVVEIAVVETIKRAVGLVSAVVLGKWLFGEDVGPLTWVAVALIGVGVVAVML